MKFALVDDDDIQLRTLACYIKELLGNGCVISCFRSGEEFLSSWKQGDYDLIILDIYMDKVLGVEVAKKIRETDREVRLVFCTTSNEFAGESYEVNARYYLRKPVTEEKVKNMLDRLRLNEIELFRSVTMPDGHVIVLRSITYAEYIGRALIIHGTKQEDIPVRVLFSEAKSIFSEFKYLCVCSKGIIVNFYEVSSLKNDMFIMKSGANVPVSRRKIKDVTDAYTAFRFERLRRDGEE